MTNPAEGYESYMVPALFGPWAALLIDAADPKAGERVLDVGCGTGVVARQVASRLGTSGAVTAIDLSPHMLAVANAAAARDGVVVDWRVGNAERLPFPERSFDLVLCQFALMFFTDKVAALSEMARVLRHGGRAVVSVWQGLERHPFYQTLHDVIQRRLGVSALQQIFSLGSPNELRGLLQRSGFSRIDVEPMSVDRTLPEPGWISCRRNRRGYRRDSIDAASRHRCSASDRRRDQRRYGIAAQRSDTRRLRGDPVPRLYRKGVALAFAQSEQHHQCYVPSNWARLAVSCHQPRTP